MTSSVTTKGMILRRETDTPGTWALVGEVTNISGPNESAEQLDATSFDSTAHEYLTALADSGEVTFDMNFIGSNATQQGLRTDLRANTLRNFRLILNDDATEGSRTKCDFSGRVTNLTGPEGGVDAVITQSCTIKVSGQPSWTYHA